MRDGLLQLHLVSAWDFYYYYRHAASFISLFQSISFRRRTADIVGIVGYCFAACFLFATPQLKILIFAQPLRLSCRARFRQL